ncbi:hypothetical protein [Jeotgalibacillus campisalis]|uniref:Competence protein ComGE n=1 Tax=Jeotgalibacillus campisalis TaxID=220754 RepID=A0A0C2VAJ7_9BACL|nr:hypothetical protein [Jeotgalibacillus campisalis]KIL45977.1 hypothetical protein KR50_26520 [Jeotgalibacillus campisalis]
MLKDHRGFAVYEAIFSLTCIVFLCTAIIPVLSQSVIKVDESKRKAASWVVLTEQLQSIKNTGHYLERIERDGTIYTTSWIENERICVMYENRSSAVSETCVQ